MKIVLIYTPRCGSTSIFKYFSKLKPEYECINEPWFGWMNYNVDHRKYRYKDIILKGNVFIKTTYKNLPETCERFIDDFDKVIFLLRRNLKEQIESSLYTHTTQSFLDYSKRKYWIDNDEIEEFSKQHIYYDNEIRRSAILYDKPLFYYEDLYYGDFKPLFEELGIGFDEKYFNEYLDKSNRYRTGTLECNNEKRLI